MKRSFARALLPCAAALLVAACASVPRDPWGADVGSGRAPRPVRVPDSLEADVGILPREAGALPFSARLYALPHRAYRLDAYGLTSVAASYAWNAGAWTLVRHDEKRAWRGGGDALEVEGAPLRLPDVHAVLGFLWGELLPGFDSVAAAGAVTTAENGVVRWTKNGEPWEATFDRATGACREVRSGSLRLRYGVYVKRWGRALPEEAEVFLDGESVLLIRLRRVGTAPSWKRDPFLLAVPSGYRQDS